MPPRTLAAAVLALGLTTGAASAQYTTEPDVYGHPELGVTSRGPHGQLCVTEPDVYGSPQYGTTTRCQ